MNEFLDVNWCTADKYLQMSEEEFLSIRFSSLSVLKRPA